MTGRSLLILGRDLADNSTGRIYALWLLGRRLGWSMKVVAPRGSKLWAPLSRTGFASVCTVLDPGLPVDLGKLRQLASEADLIIAAKPFPETLGLAWRLGLETDRPILLDIDDPDIEVRLPLTHPIKLVARAILGPSELRSAWAMRRLARQSPVIVSNPALQRIHGGEVIAHVRADTGRGKAHLSAQPSIAFVGTNRRHKGMGLLRRAVARLSNRGFTLTVTDVAPADATSWENWTGPTNLEDGLELVRGSDIIVVPSLPGHITSELQLPAKLMDAMIAGRGVVVSDFAPLRWAVGDAGLVIRAGSEAALTAALAKLADPEVRSALGRAARARALDLFTVESVAATFERACLAAIEGTRRPAMRSAKRKLL